MYDKYKQYVGRKKEQAGRRYEAFVADTLRQEGWEVIETGRDKFDHGIDLIATKDGVRRYVQCKGWRPDSLIHEDVVSQLYGSVAGIEGPDNLEGVEIYIYSPASLGEYAQMESDKLHIHLVRLDMPMEPRRFHPRHYFRRRKHHFRANV